MVEKVNQAGLRKTPTRSRTEIDFKRVDESKLAEGLDAYEQAFLERLERQSLSSEKAWQDRLRDIKYSEGGEKSLNEPGALFGRVLDELVEMGRITAEAADKAKAADVPELMNIERVGGRRCRCFAYRFVGRYSSSIRYCI